MMELYNLILAERAGFPPPPGARSTGGTLRIKKDLIPAEWRRPCNMSG
jgi:hypothetical protein